MHGKRSSAQPTHAPLRLLEQTAFLTHTGQANGFLIATGLNAKTADKKQSWWYSRYLQVERSVCLFCGLDFRRRAAPALYERAIRLPSKQKSYNSESY